jgi:hypothetical protein
LQGRPSVILARINIAPDRTGDGRVDFPGNQSEIRGMLTPVAMVKTA